MPEHTRRQDRDRRSRRERIGRVLVILVGLVLAFVLGMAFAQTLDDRPRSSGAETTFERSHRFRRKRQCAR